MSEPDAVAPAKPRKRTTRARPAAEQPTPQPRESMRETYSQPVAATVAPLAALHREIARTEAAVEWLQSEIAKLEPDQLHRGTRSVRRVEDANGIKTVTEAGSVRHELLQLFIDERRHLHALCRDAMNVKQSEAPGTWPRAS